MTASETDQELRKEVARMKETALKNSARTTRTLGVSLIAAVVVGLVAWFNEEPTYRDDVHVGFALGLSGFVFFIGCLLGRFLFPRPDAKCPKCGCDWNVESDNDMQTWLNWRRCPGCGLNMRED